jgi:hypothetical protein
VLRKKDQIDFAILEYNRDPDFRKSVDLVVDRLRVNNLVPVGLPLETIFGLEIEGGEPLAKHLLRQYHERANHQQWRRVLDLARASSQ